MNILDKIYNAELFYRVSNFAGIGVKSHVFFYFQDKTFYCIKMRKLCRIGTQKMVIQNSDAYVLN